MEPAAPVVPTDFPTDARVTDVSPDGRLWALELHPRANQQYGCVGLFDLHTFTVVARSCDVSGLTFSPDGKHLLGGYYENNMIGDVTVVDLDLQPVGSVATDRGSVVSRMAWADPDHLLVGVAGLEDGRWSLQRFALDGRDPRDRRGSGRRGNPEQVAEYQFSEKRVGEGARVGATCPPQGVESAQRAHLVSSPQVPDVRAPTRGPARVPDAPTRRSSAYKTRRLGTPPTLRPDLGHRQRVGGQVERGRSAAPGDHLGAERGHHGAVVGAQPGAGTRTGCPARRPPRPSPAAGSSRRHHRR